MKIKTKILNFFRSILKFRLVENILRSFVKGKLPNSVIAKLVPNNYQYKKHTWRVFEKNGVRLKVDIHDYVGHYLYFQFKDIGQEKLLSMVNESDYVLDIGTNIGSTILSFANKVGSLGKVYGFEPDKLNYDLCVQNISLNDFQNIDVSNIGLGDSIGSFKMINDIKSNRGMNRITHNLSVIDYTEIFVDTLDNWLIENLLGRIDLIKMDVEGFELKVLMGGRASILSYRPKLFIELDDNNLKAVGDSASRLVHFLENDLGYNRILNAETQELLNYNDSFINCHFDIIATCN